MAAPRFGFVRTCVSRRFVSFVFLGPRADADALAHAAARLAVHVLHVVVRHHLPCSSRSLRRRRLAGHRVLGHFELVHRRVEHFHLVHVLLHLVELLGHLGHGFGGLLAVALLQPLLHLAHLLGHLLQLVHLLLLLLHLVELLLQLAGLGEVALLLLLFDLLLEIVHRLLMGLRGRFELFLHLLQLLGELLFGFACRACLL